MVAVWSVSQGCGGVVPRRWRFRFPDLGVFGFRSCWKWDETCDVAVVMAEAMHFNRYYCGKCHLTYLIKKEGQPTARSLKPPNPAGKFRDHSIGA